MSSCPYCKLALPDPPDRFCPSCGGDLAAQRPPGPAPRAGRSASPWDRRAEIGFLLALIDTTKQVLLTPVEFFRNMQTSGGIGSPLFYGVLLGYLSRVVEALYVALFHALFWGGLATLSRSQPFGPMLGMFQGGFPLVVTILTGPISAVVALFICAGVFHLMLLMFEGADQGFEATLRVVSYAAAAAVLGIIPVCGGLFGLVYSIVLWVIGLSEAHGIGRGKACAAVLVPLGLLLACCALLVFVFAAGLASVFSRFR